MSALLRILMIDPNSIVVMEFQCNWWNYHYLGWATNNFHCKYKLFILPWWIAEERFCFCCTTHINWWNLVKITNSYYRTQTSYQQPTTLNQSFYIQVCTVRVFRITDSVSRVCVWIKSLSRRSLKPGWVVWRRSPTWRGRNWGLQAWPCLTTCQCSIYCNFLLSLCHR